jgi:hypothetical protein
MLKPKFFLFPILILYAFSQAVAQDELNVKFGKITASDFQTAAPKFDTGANAVILSDIGRTTFEGNGKDFFSIIYTRFVRIKILNRNGYHAADFEILLYNDRKGTDERLTTLKGSTYNIQNGSVQVTKLDDKSVFTTRYSKHYDQLKFSMPALSLGSIFELTYTIKSSNFSDPPSWIFQSDYPCLWSEYKVTIPSFFHYYVKTGGNGQFDIKTTKNVEESFLVQKDGGTEQLDDIIKVYTTSIENRWVRKNVPAIKKQPFLSTVKNYVPRISFELNYYQQGPEFNRHLELGTWFSKSRKLLASEDFGSELDQDNHWMDNELKNVVQNTFNREEEIKAIFHFVRDNFHCTDFSEKFVQTSLKDVFNNRSGNVAEINLLLVAMLRHEHIQADPAMLSTRDNGFSAIDFPLLYEYNYVICVVKNASKQILLDASQPNNSYGNLPGYCYNWQARVINETLPFSVSLSPDSVTDSRETNVHFVNDEKGKLAGGLTTTYGMNESFDKREEIKKSSEKEFFKEIPSINDNVVIMNQGFDSLKQPDRPLILHYDLEAKDIDSKEILYFTPVLTPFFETNPFADAERLYPVEMPAKIDYSYTLNMSIPKGFKIDELPKSARVSYNENDGMFEYLIQQSGEKILMRVHLKFNEATFPTDQYSSLRDFFAFIVNKESEQIVFKKL